MPRSHQNQHAAGAEQNGMAVEGAGEDGVSHELSARKAGGVAVFCEGDTEGVQEDIASDQTPTPLKHRGTEGAEDISVELYAKLLVKYGINTSTRS